MLIQVYGAGFDNRGAQLMLWTTIDRLRAMSQDVKIAIEVGRSTPRQRAGYDLLTLAPSVSHWSPRKTRLLRGYDFVSRALPRKVANDYGLARRRDVDAFIDVSGYAFGDTWPPIMAESIQRRVAHFKREKKPVIFLPQMLGPFKNAKWQEAFGGVLRDSDRVYARDEESLKAVRAIAADESTIRLAPDITIWAEGVAVNTPASQYACLVPNVKMREKAGETWGKTYLDAMERSAKRLEERGVDVYLVVHDGSGRDEELACELVQRAGLPEDRIFRNEDPRQIKSFLANATMTIGSRFHALVSSLSSGTPVIALGWAHKYETLMQEFGVFEYCCNHSAGPDCTLEMIDKLLDEDERSRVERLISDRKSELKPNNEAMWKDVSTILGLQYSSC